ncbi:EamA family transporter [Nostocoides sp. F2B08]|uniref:DMT family transporter n=1 Tax=Nostocoides sp. F2B08 TaxID=2653936 RepID=UPI00126368B6|nr:DMT family transporter [Tetrasphaera sp. F2B08]KAB7743888.1 EamA family transporter [Tetrasphaera sp. F2B08]
MNQTRRAGLVLALVTATISAFSVYVNGLAVRLFDSATVYTTAKNLVAALVLGLVAILSAQRSRTSSGQRFHPRGRRQWLGLAAVGVVGGSVPFVLFFEGLSRASSPQAAFLHKTLIVWVAILAAVVLRERLRWPHLAAVGLLLLGQVGLSRAGLFPLDAGAVMIFAATLLWSIEVVVAKRLLADVPSSVLAVARMGLGSIVLLVWVAVQGQLGAFGSLTAVQLQWLVLTGLLLAGYVGFWFAALARAQAIDVTAILVVGAVGTAVLAGVLDGASLAPQVPWLVTITAGALLVGATMARRPAVEAAPR